ncbi:hypothetical protein A1O7_08453 [Cladophialophora yegresii CBS 114405]|uniref:MHYT domain-containing protein n=1 Tax=Cladophialophora yegresii CBS 114405 TaxID=1182544 RepID=W9VR83_9EURO|nr:uncharacterized protein A1O7_08453 [Cladophialophora yegresii CBS 114405]EXJ55525.1 hypothetical protein A1O7_08453 [Cladophialophora yegresii CBS 114405]
MGGIGIWGMHFVGNRAIVLQGGDPERQILYNPGYTAISFFLPIVVLLFAFYTLGMPTRVRQLHVAAAGFFTGAAVCGMHYLGQYSVENYTCSYRVQNVVGAAMIAVLASFIALSIFFRLRDAWMDSWWKRVLCGAILATAVSGMHWTAAVGTIYHWKRDVSSHGNSRSQTAIVAAALAMSSCVILLIAAFVRGRNKHTAKIKAQRLVLACAYFDDEGKLMVTQEGTLPSEKITNHYVERTFGEDELSRSHATYLWIFKASRNWTVLRDLIPGMKEYIETDPVARKYRAGNTAPNLSEDTIDGSLNFAPIFKQLFCVAAQQLANLTHEPLEKLGVLFEEPLETGAAPATTNTRTGGRPLSAKGFDNGPDAEIGISSPTTAAKGKYFFLHRQISKAEAARFAALGYRFATVGQIAEPLAKSMQVHRDRLVSRIERMKLSASPEHLLPPGVHLACFMLRPSMYKSFDVLVPASSQNQLPYVTVQSGDLSADQFAELQRFDDLSISEILRVLVNRSNTTQIGEEIRWQLYNTFVKLVDVLGDYDSMMQAKFSAKAFQIPCRQSTTATSTRSCTLLTVRVLRSIHAAPTKKELTYVPLSFFSAQQQIQACEKDDGFEQTVRAEFRHPAPCAVKHSPRTSIKDGRRTSSTDSTVQGLESPRSGLFSISKFSILPSRRSDEATFVEREKSITEGSEVEMGGMSDSAHLDRQPRVTHLDVAALKQAGSNWVSEVFGLFRLGAEGWSNAKGGKWEWDIRVENSFEVGLNDRNQSVTDTNAREIFDAK